MVATARSRRDCQRGVAEWAGAAPKLRGPPDRQAEVGTDAGVDFEGAPSVTSASVISIPDHAQAFHVRFTVGSAARTASNALADLPRREAALDQFLAARTATRSWKV